VCTCLCINYACSVFSRFYATLNDFLLGRQMTYDYHFDYTKLADFLKKVFPRGGKVCGFAAGLYVLGTTPGRARGGGVRRPLP